MDNIELFVSADLLEAMDKVRINDNVEIIWAVDVLDKQIHLEFWDHGEVTIPTSKLIPIVLN